VSTPSSINTAERLTARELILTLMDSAAGTSLGVGYFLAAGQLFGMDPGSVRVALARLVRDGSLVTVERGRYGLGSRAGTLHALVRNWSKVEDSLVKWPGGWFSVWVGHLARSNKTRVRGNERALKLYGFAEVRSGFWIRPDNLTLPLTDIRSSLIQLGLDADNLTGRLSQLEPGAVIRPEILWDTPELDRRYRQHIDMLRASSETLAGLDEPSAARETLLVGRQVTRDILLDPLLPDELIDNVPRRQMVAAMRNYDRIGKAYWRKFYERYEGKGRGQKPAA